MKRFVIGDEKYTEEEQDEIFYIEPPKDSEEVNTSYNQDQEIGDSPQAYQAVGAEPIDAKTGEDFYSIQTGGKAEGMGGFEGVWKQLGYENKDEVLSYIKNNTDKGVDEIEQALGYSVGGKLIELKNEGKIEYNGRGWQEFLPFGNDWKNPLYEKFESRKQQQWYHASGQTFYDDEPHEARKVKGEKLNKDGTGTAVARRGINPNNKKHIVMKFDYVSQSDCPICRPYDGKTFGRDSPNRPVIPRLESQGKQGSRPYTHPNCKCRWIKVFNEVSIRASEMDMNPELIAQARARADDPKVFDSLTRVQRDMTIIRMLRKDLGMEFIETLDPVPLASMVVMTFDAIKEPLKRKLGIGEARVKANEDSPYRVQPMLDAIVAKSLGKEEKSEIEEEVSTEFTLDNLLRLVADKLASKTAKKLGLESRRAHERDMMTNRQMNDQAYDIMAEEEWGKSVEQLTNIEYKWIEDLMQDYGNELTSEDKPKAGESRKVKGNEHDVWDEKTNMLLDPTTLEDKKKEAEEIDWDIEEREMDKRRLGGPRPDDISGYGLPKGVPTPYEDDNERAERIQKDMILGTARSEMKDDISNTSNVHDWQEGGEGVKEILGDILEGSIFMGKDKEQFKKNLEADEVDPNHFADSKSWYQASDDKEKLAGGGLSDDYDGLPDWNKENIDMAFDAMRSGEQVDRSDWYSESATEGGRGSGKIDHKPWMLGAELGNICEICMISTEWNGTVCTMCGTDSKTL